MQNVTKYADESNSDAVKELVAKGEVPFSDFASVFKKTPEVRSTSWKTCVRPRSAACGLPFDVDVTQLPCTHTHSWDLRRHARERHDIQNRAPNALTNDHSRSDEHNSRVDSAQQRQNSVIWSSLTNWCKGWAQSGRRSSGAKDHVAAPLVCLVAISWVYMQDIVCW